MMHRASVALTTRGCCDNSGAPVAQHLATKGTHWLELKRAMFKRANRGRGMSPMSQPMRRCLRIWQWGVTCFCCRGASLLDVGRWRRAGGRWCEQQGRCGCCPVPGSSSGPHMPRFAHTFALKLLYPVPPRVPVPAGALQRSLGRRAPLPRPLSPAASVLSVHCRIAASLASKQAAGQNGSHALQGQGCVALGAKGSAETMAVF